MRYKDQHATLSRPFYGSSKVCPTAGFPSLWFRGIQLLPVAQVSILGLLSPLVATLSGWIILDQSLSVGQLTGAVLVLGAVWLGQTHKTDECNASPCR